MTLFIKEKDTAFKDRFLITDEDSRICYTAEGKHLALNKKLTIFDSHNKPLAVVQKKALALTPKYAVLVEDEEVAELHKESSLLGKPYYKVEGPNWTVDGDIWDREYNIRRNMDVIAKIRPALLSPKDTCKITLSDEINPLMVVAVVTAISCILDAEGPAAANTEN